MSKKPLPTYATSQYTATLPVSGQVVKYRAYNVADERLLVAAASAKDQDKDFYVTNTLGVIQSAILNDVNARKLPSTDVRYLLLQLRGKSVGNEIEVSFKGQTVALDIDKFYVQGLRTKDDYKIKLNDSGLGLLMKDQSFEDEVMSALEVSRENPTDLIFRMIIDSVHAIYDNDDVWYVGEDITKQDVETFVGQIPSTESKPVYDFIKNMPVLAVDIDIQNNKGEFETVTITNRDVDFLSSGSAT